MADVCSGDAVLDLDPEATGTLRLGGAAGSQGLAELQDLWAVEAGGRQVTAAQADCVSVTATESGLRLRWELAEPAMVVDVEARPGAEGTFELTWQARAASAAGLRLNEVHFPRLRATDSVAYVMRPAATYWPEVRIEDLMRTDWDDQAEAAVLVHDAAMEADAYVGGLYPSAWAAVPFFAAWGDGGQALYVGAHDAEAHTKTVLWDRRQVQFTYHVPDPDVPQASLSVPYPIVLGAVVGDWHEAAAIYRHWSRRRAPWCRRGPVTATAPSWAQESVAWFYGLGCAGPLPLPLEQTLPRLREVLGIAGPIGVHALAPQHQEHSNMPNGEPDPWLRRYKERQHAIAAAHGFHVFEYRNTHKYTKDYPGYESAKPHACRWRGRLHEEGPYGGGPDFGSASAPVGTEGTRQVGEGDDAYGQRDRGQMYPLVEMCIGTEYWQQKLLDAVAPCVSYGTVGNYLDQIGSNRNFSRCDHPGRRHPGLPSGSVQLAPDATLVLEGTVA